MESGSINGFNEKKSCYIFPNIVVIDYNDPSNIGESKFGMKHRINLNIFVYILIL